MGAPPPPFVYGPPLSTAAFVFTPRRWAAAALAAPCPGPLPRDADVPRRAAAQAPRRARSRTVRGVAAARRRFVLRPSRLGVCEEVRYAAVLLPTFRTA